MKASYRTILFLYSTSDHPSLFATTSTSSSLSSPTVPSHLEAIMSAAVSVPEHKLFESPNSRSIHVNGWVITASTNPISNAFECDTLQGSLGIPLPEMTFGNNILTLEHRPSGWKYSFTAADALRLVKKGELEDGDGGVKVNYADAWLKSRCALFLAILSTLDLNQRVGPTHRRISRCPRPLRPSLTTGHIPRYIQGTQNLKNPVLCHRGRHQTKLIQHITSPSLSSLDPTRSCSTLRYPCSRTSCTIMGRRHLL